MISTFKQSKKEEKPSQSKSTPNPKSDKKNAIGFSFSDRDGGNPEESKRSDKSNTGGQDATKQSNDDEGDDSD